MSMDCITVDYPNNGWTKEVIDGWNKAFSTGSPIVALDLSRTEFVNLFDWLTVVAMMEKVLVNPNVKSFRIDSKGSDPASVIPLNDFIHIERSEHTNKSYHQNEISLSRRIYQTVGFIESLGTLDILNRNREGGKLYYPGIDIKDIKKHRFYTGKTDEPNVILGLTAIRTKEDCQQFLDENNIRNWVRTMGRRFPESPLFES
ncbi:MAG: hypothetical protein GY757_13800, partial [bacterium]|nr:hypothetical protein [bacterium]